jgi:hypothetical protein
MTQMPDGIWELSYDRLPTCFYSRDKKQSENGQKDLSKSSRIPSVLAYLKDWTGIVSIKTGIIEDIGANKTSRECIISLELNMKVCEYIHGTFGWELMDNIASLYTKNKWALPIDMKPPKFYCIVQKENKRKILPIIQTIENRYSTTIWYLEQPFTLICDNAQALRQVLSDSQKHNLTNCKK